MVLITLGECCRRVCHDVEGRVEVGNDDDEDQRGLEQVAFAGGVHKAQGRELLAGGRIDN